MILNAFFTGAMALAVLFGARTIRSRHYAENLRTFHIIVANVKRRITMKTAKRLYVCLDRLIKGFEELETSFKESCSERVTETGHGSPLENRISDSN
jgi:hypothetical protein